MCDKLVGFDIFFTNNALSHFFNLFLAVYLCIIAFKGASCRFLFQCAFLWVFPLVYEGTPKWGLSLQGVGVGAGKWWELGLQGSGRGCKEQGWEQGSGGSEGCKEQGRSCEGVGYEQEEEGV